MVGILTIATLIPTPDHGHLVGNMRTSEPLPKPTLPDLASRVPWSPAHPFLGHRRCRGLLAALRPALRRTSRAGRCSWHGHHLLAVRALPESGPEHVAGCSWRGPRTPVRHLSVLAHSAAEGWACGAAARDRGTLSLCAGPPPSEV